MILEVDLLPPLHVMQFFVEVHPGPCFISSMDLAWELAHLFWNLLAGVHKRYTSEVYDCINLDGSLIKLDTMSYLIKEGYFNLSTMLNLKSLWMHLARKTSKPEHTNINKGSMPLYDQAKLIKRWTWINCRWTLSYLCTYLSVLTSSIFDGSFWSWYCCGMVISGRRRFLHVDAGWSGGRHVDHADSGGQQGQILRTGSF